MRFTVGLVLTGALAVVGCGSDSGSGVGGSNGGNGAAPEVTDVAWTAAADCTRGTTSDVVITVTASDPDTNETDLIYSGSVTGCAGAINAAISTVSCPNAATYGGTVMVSDPGQNDSIPVSFDVPVCASGSCTEAPTSCSL
jgi:hypothetical protein